MKHVLVSLTYQTAGVSNDCFMMLRIYTWGSPRFSTYLVHFTQIIMFMYIVTKNRYLYGQN